MSAPELRRRVLAIFEKGTLEELSTVLALVYVISTAPRSHKAGKRRTLTDIELQAIVANQQN